MKNTFWAVGLLLASFPPTFSQSLILDLASEPTGSLSLPLQTGNHTVLLKNKLPGGDYEIKVAVEDVLIEPFSVNTLSQQPLTKNYQKKDCPGLKSIVELINQLDSEAELPAKRAELKTLLKDNDGCDEYPLAVNMDTTFDCRFEIKDLKKSQILKITVKRTNKAGKVLEWVRIYKTPERGKWLTSYSFNFITQWFSKERLFFAKNIGMDSFQITQENNLKWVDFVPGITFTWLPADEVCESWAIGGSGGIGFDLEKPVVFVGVSLIYNQNLSLTLGAAAHQVKDLHGKYNEGDIIRENLSPDQLMIEPYRVNPFISLSLRFDKNPFALGK